MSKIGISVAMLSPFDDAGALDTGRLAAHAVNLLKAGVHGVTVMLWCEEQADRSRGLRTLDPCVAIVVVESLRSGPLYFTVF